MRQHIFRLCKVDELALTGTLPVVQGTQHRKRRASATRRIHVEDRRTGAQVEIGIAAYGRQATEGFNIAAKSLKGAIGTSTAKAWHGYVDDVGFPPPHGIIVQPQSRHHSQGVVFDDHIAQRDQPARDVVSLRARQVHRHAELIAGVEVEHRVPIPGTLAWFPVRISGQQVRGVGQEGAGGRGARPRVRLGKCCSDSTRITSAP